MRSVLLLLAAVGPPPAVDLTAVFLSAVAGALFALDDTVDFDPAGVFGMAIISGFGGGILRDILLQQGLPAALTDSRYLIAVMIAAAIVLPFGSLVRRLGFLFLLVDAAGLGIYAMLGLTKALAVDVPWLPAIFVGVVAATGGGLLRDVFAGRVPQIFLPGTLVATAAAAGCIVYLLLDRAGLREEGAVTAGAIAAFAVHLIAVRLGWETPSAKRVHTVASTIRHSATRRRRKRRT